MTKKKSKELKRRAKPKPRKNPPAPNPAPNPALELAGEGQPELIENEQTESQATPEKPPELSVVGEVTEPETESPVSTESIEKLQEGAESAALGNDYFSITQILDNEDYEEEADKAGASIDVAFRSTGKQEWFRSRPGKDSDGLPYCGIKIKIIEDEEEYRDKYIVFPQVAASLQDFVIPVYIFACQNRGGANFFAYIKAVNMKGVMDSRITSYLNVMAQAQKNLVRRLWNGRIHEAIHHTARVELPEWPEWTVEEMLNIAFPAPYQIKDLDHSFARRLLGLCGSNE